MSAAYFLPYYSVHSSCFPDWALDLPQHFPFLFPFATHYNFLQPASFSCAPHYQAAEPANSWTGRLKEGRRHTHLQRRKVRILRKHILDQPSKSSSYMDHGRLPLKSRLASESGQGTPEICEASGHLYFHLTIRSNILVCSAQAGLG
jgi:hypothetical protein